MIDAPSPDDICNLQDTQRLILGIHSAGWACPPGDARLLCVVIDSYLVDPASSHMLVSKIKPCMSKYKQILL